MAGTIAVIAARGGSKGVPDKNLADFCGRPLLAWSIDHARTAKGVDAVWVTSDSPRILELAETCGAGSIERPADLAGDTATSEVAWLHAIDQIERECELELVVALQATSPLREAADIERGLSDFRAQGCDSLFSGARIEDFLIWERGDDGRLDSLNHDWRRRLRRQDVPDQFVENGSFYIFTPELLRNSGNRLGGRVGISEMAFWKSFEVDTPESLAMCEALAQRFLIAGGAVSA